MTEQSNPKILSHAHIKLYKRQTILTKKSDEYSLWYPLINSSYHSAMIQSTLSNTLQVGNYLQTT